MRVEDVKVEFREGVNHEGVTERAIELLKMLEYRSAGHGEGPIAEYDFGWMWVELGLQDHRK